MGTYILSRGTLSSSAESSIYSVSSGNSATVVNAVLSNASSSSISIAVSIGTASSKTLLTSVVLPAGVGKSKIVAELIGGLGSTNSIFLQPSLSSGVNYVIYGTAVSA